jgi:uncharacterized repeat protein (TIGR03803 family)
MFLPTWLSGTFSHSQARRGQRRNPAARPRKARLFLERLESRVALSFGISTLGLFNGTNGSSPQAGLIMDSSGNLYGTTLNGCVGFNGNYISGDGTVFEVAKGSQTITTLASFNGTNGEFPYAALIMDSSGNLYGTTEGGGASGVGTVFELAKGSGTITTLASFDCTNGQYPYAALIMNSSGNLYGTTEKGGASLGGLGTVFELAQGSGRITTMASFGGSSGHNPLAGLIMDGSGNLYGTTELGGAHGAGTVFELAKGGDTITTLASFNGANGADPRAGLIMDSSGNLYGTTEYGGANSNGTVFEVGAGSGRITTMISFGGSNGDVPVGGLIVDGSGNFFGTTEQGGADGDGAVFELPATAHPSLQIGGFPSSTSAGSAQTFTVTIQSADGTTDTGYTGTVHFTTNDRTANLVANDTAPDMGTDPFSGLVPQKKGKSSITDTLFSSITGSLSADGF